MKADEADLMDPAIQQCPYAYYRTLREEAPIYPMRESGIHLVTTDQLARRVLRDPDTFVSGVNPMALADGGEVTEKIIEIYRQEGWLPLSSCSTTDPPRHKRVRRFLETLFTAQRVRLMTPMIDRLAVELLDDLGGATEVEWVAAFAHPFPMRVIAELLGIAGEDLERFKRWSDAIVEPFSMMATRERRVECAHLVVEMQHYFVELIEQRRTRPGDDFISEAVAFRDADGSAFDLQELLTIITIDLLASGNETTTAAIGSGVRLLAESPGTVRELQKQPGLVSHFVEEILRLESPAQGMFRRCTEATRLGGVQLEVDVLLNVRFGAANRDEGRYPDPEAIDLHRSKPGSHLAFGMGRHVCVGAALARQELLSAFTELLRRYEGFELNPQKPAPVYQPSFFGRNLERLDVLLRPASATAGNTS